MVRFVGGVDSVMSRILGIVAALLVSVGLLVAGDNPPKTSDKPAPLPDYSKPHSHIPFLFYPYVPRPVPQNDFSNSSRMGADRKSTRLNSSHVSESRMPSSA